MAFVELHCHSAYSFLDGASHPEELAARAAELGYEALALTDHDGVYGSLEFAHAAKAFGVRPITGAEVSLSDGSHVTLLVESPRGYANLCRLLTAGHAGTRPKPTEPIPPSLDRHLFAELNEGLVCLSGCARDGLAARNGNGAAELAAIFGRDRFFVELQRPYERGDAQRNGRLRQLAETIGVQTVVTGNVHAHNRRRALLQDAMVAIRGNTSLEGAERERRGNHECVLLPPDTLAERFPDDLDAVARTAELAARLEFDVTQELGYRYPDFSDRDEPAIAQLTGVCNHAFEARYGGANGHKRKARARLDEELALIGELGLAGFFLLHWEVLELAKEVAREVRGRKSPRHSLPPGRGRGSSVGSLVCYLTGLSHVDPVAAGLSLGRFLNRELDSVPDIDLDFPRDIREKLIVALTERYGDEHAALVASFSTYRSRGAIRDLGKALGLPFAELERLARVTEGNPKRVEEEIAKLPDGEAKLRSRRWRALGALSREIAGLPRHISQHPGGMVISSRPLVELVPVQPAAMEGRQICQWDKDSCADAGFLKIDLLGLGMLSAVERCVDLIERKRGERIDLSRIPFDDEETYAAIQVADTMGVFQIESRAQMQSLYRTRPASLDDLTVQVAIVRPGPILGGAVNPYIARRQQMREDPDFVVPYDHPSLEPVLRDTLGTIIFQDQVIEVAMAFAGFTPGEAEGLRRAMSRKRSAAAIESYHQRFVEGAARTHGADAETAERVYSMIVGFSGFGFPKAHGAAFGLLAYQSTWLRVHYGPEFLCALLNEQPMGFYAPDTLAHEAQRKGIELIAPDVNLSQEECTVDADGRIRLGLSYVLGARSAEVAALVAAREEGGPFRSLSDLASRAGAGRAILDRLAWAGACDALAAAESPDGAARRTALWRLGVAAPGTTVRDGTQLALPLDLPGAPALDPLAAWDAMVADYATTGLTLGAHPVELLRPELPAGAVSTRDLEVLPHDTPVTLGGLVVARQRPGTAKGIVFLLLEDELGTINLIVPPPVYERHRLAVRTEPLLLVWGKLEKLPIAGGALNVYVRGIRPLS